MIIKEKFGPEKKAAASAARYGLLRTGQSILAKKNTGWKDQHRMVWCSRSLKRGDYATGEGGFVAVYRNPDRDGATFAGLNRCGSLHCCPVCAAKVQELRRKQLSAAMVRHVGNDGAAYLVTLTFPHGPDETLASLLERFIKARDRFRGSRQFKEWRKAAGVVGIVTSLEFTVSLENGWHPHIHLLVFSAKKAFGEGAPNEHGDLDSYLIADLRKLWCQHLFKAGLGDNSKLQDMLKHALNVRGGEKAAEYIAKFGRDEKWGASSELARSHAKIGAAGEAWGVQHFTPFQLLVWAGEGDGWAVHRFREYAEVVEGKKALTWSKGLKTALGVADVDEELWAQQDQPAPEQVLLGEITAKQFSKLLERKIIPRFLVYAATCCDNQEHLDEFFDGLDDTPKIAGGAMLLKEKIGRRLAYA